MKNSIKILAVAFVLLFAFSWNLQAQISKGGTPPSFKFMQKSAAAATIPTERMAELDVPALLIEDSLEMEQTDLPMRFGYPFDVNYSLFNSGVWDSLPDGSRIWQLRIEAPGAKSINLLYNDFDLPEGVELYIYNEDRSMVIGAFTSENNKPTGEFATQPVAGDVSILELYVPAGISYPGRLTVSRVVHAYRDIFFNQTEVDKLIDFLSSGSCNINVNCPEGYDWQQDKKSVAMILTGSGIRWCSGSLINNVRQDFTPYFLTANHCLSGYASWIFMFNYECPTCPTTANGPTWMTTSGSVLRANHTNSDFALVEMLETPPASYDVYFAGWSNINTPVDSTVAIHHPSGDVKKISFNFDPIVSTNYYTTSGTTHWMVDNWELGTTEGGSSGSPLFDPNHRIIGQLHGGEASCSVIGPDWYGKFSYSWDNSPDSQYQLKHWLDPDNTGATTLDGISPIGLYAEADTTIGDVPFQVQFTGSAAVTVDSWLWIFGDGNTSTEQSPLYTYNNPGEFDVTLRITSDGNTYNYYNYNYIFALADTLETYHITGGIDSTVMLPIRANNTVELEEINIPLEYSGDVPLQYDSISVVGCRTDYFERHELGHYSSFSKEATIRLLASNDGSLPPLSPGEGLIAKVYFTILSSASIGDTTTIVVDGYTDHDLEFINPDLTYQPKFTNGAVEVIYTGCCVGMRGNINNDELDEIDVEDLVYFIDYQFQRNPVDPPACFDEADVNNDGYHDVADIVYLIEYMFDDPNGPPPVNCPYQ